MKWLWLALLAPAFDTAVIFVDKYVVEHKVKDSHCMPIYSGIAACLFATALWLIVGMPTLSNHNAWLLVLTGVLSMLAYALYFHALIKSAASYINALLQTTPIFILILSAVLLHQSLGGLQIVGFVLVFAAVIGLSVDRIERKVKLNAAFWQILLANLLFAAAAISVAYTTEQPGFVPLMVYSSWGLAIGAALLFAASRRIRTAFLVSFRKIGKPTLSIVLANESLATLSQALSFLAITLGPVALVGVLGGTQVFYAIIFGVTLTLLFPKLFNESTERKDIAVKVALSAVLFVGIACIGASAV